MDVSCKIFAVSCLYFDNIEEKGKEVDKSVAKLHCQRRYNVSPCAQMVLLLLCISMFPFMLFMKENANAVTKFYGTPLFNIILIEIQQHAIVRYPWNTTTFTPDFTRQFILYTLIHIWTFSHHFIFSQEIPHLTLLSQIQAMKEAMNEMQASIMEEIQLKLNAMCVVSNGFLNTKTLMTKIDMMQKELFTRINTRTAVAVTRSL